jgi:hypothetical protein
VRCFRVEIRGDWSVGREFAARRIRASDVPRMLASLIQRGTRRQGIARLTIFYFDGM